MKAVLVISLSLLVFFQSVGIGVSDLFMLSELIEHAKYHSEEYGDDFFTFFEKHYGDLKLEHQKTNTEERAQHEKLPFQHNNVNHLLSEVVVPFYQLSLKKSVSLYDSKKLFYYKDLYSFLQKGSIFQPPQFA